MKLNSPIQRINSSHFDSLELAIDIKRDDLIHATISGNKWRKLKFLLEDAKHKKCSKIVSMGGNWSNHLHALAYAGKENGFETIGYVRAHADQKLTPTMQDCIDWGMKLIFTNKVEYAQLRTKIHWDSFSKTHTNSYWLSEGGFSDLAIKGVIEIAQEVEQPYDYIFTGVGSGATLIGLAKAFPHSSIVGVAAFKGADYLESQLTEQFPNVTNWTLEQNFHCGGFAKRDSKLTLMIKEIEQHNNFKLDYVYNGKTFLALIHYIKSGMITSSNKVLVIHTGGIQGTRN